VNPFGLILQAKATEVDYNTERREVVKSKFKLLIRMPIRLTRGGYISMRIAIPRVLRSRFGRLVVGVWGPLRRIFNFGWGGVVSSSKLLYCSDVGFCGCQVFVEDVFLGVVFYSDGFVYAW